MIISGNKLALDLYAYIRKQSLMLPIKPKIYDILVGKDTVFSQYVQLKKRKALSAGMEFEALELDEFISAEDLQSTITEINKQADVCGLLVQLPLPKHINVRKALDSIEPTMDVDVLNIKTREAFYSGKPSLIPPTAAAILYVLDSLGIDQKKLSYLVIGQGDLVGKPVTYLLNKRGFAVKTADKNTADLQKLVKESDVIISGVGKPRLITGKMIKSGVIIIDAGTTEDSGEVVGDVDFESVFKKALWISPVPGGVGPLTVAMLFKNVLEMAQKKLKK